MQKLFETYFSLEEAVSLLPFVKASFTKAHQALDVLRDDVILYKRLQQLGESEGADALETTMRAEVLHQKWHDYEDCFQHWVNVLTDRGIQVRDFKKGLIDFPYLSQDGTAYFLCWQFGEDGLFYFHDVYEGFHGRKPISLLPD